METNQTIDDIKKTYILGFRGILKIAAFRKNFLTSKAGRLILLVSIILTVIFSFSNINLFQFITELKDKMIDFLPNILGFTIAGYSLVVGFVQSNMLSIITERAKDSDFSVYQKMSAVFATNIILQCFALFIAFGFHFIIYLDKDMGYTLINNHKILHTINTIGVFVLIYLFILSSFITIKIIENIFNFSQLHQYVINKEKLKQLKNNTNQ